MAIRSIADMLRNIPQCANNKTWKIKQSKSNPELFIVCWRNNEPLFTFKASDLRHSFQVDLDDFEELDLITK